MEFKTDVATEGMVGFTILGVLGGAGIVYYTTLVLELSALAWVGALHTLFLVPPRSALFIACFLPRARLIHHKPTNAQH